MYGSSQDRQSNFADLMYIANQNARDAKKKAANTHMFPETAKKRVDPKQVKLKEGVAKFLAKKDEEEREKKEAERRKKEKLLELRNQDRKATNRVRKMLSMTKSANKSCVDDAKDCLNASISAQAQAGDFQPDEDDYGYTSNFADQMHKKMMEKYKSIPVKPAFPQSRLDVPKAQSLPRTNKNWTAKQEYNPEEGDVSPEESSHRHHNRDYSPSSSSARRPDKSQRAAAKRPQPPDYHKLLQLAQENKGLPVPAIPILPEKKIEKEEFEFGRPMTKKEKAAYLAEKELKERAAARHGGMRSDKNNNTNGSKNGSADSNHSDKPSTSFKIPKANSKPRNMDEERNELPPKRPKVAYSDPPSRQMPNGTAKCKPNDNTMASSNGRPPSSSSQSSTMSSSKVSNGTGMKMRESIRKPQEKLRNDNQSSSQRSPSSPHFSSSRHKVGREAPNQINSRSGDNFSPRYEQERKQERIQIERQQHIRRIREERERQQQEREERLRQEREAKERAEKERLKQERLEKIKERPKYLSAFDGSSQRDRDQGRKQLPGRDNVKPCSSNRDRDMGREGRSSMSNNGSNSSNGRGSYQDSKPSRRADTMPPPQRMREPPSRMREESPPRMKTKYKGRAVIDSEDEYDSEMDDFIDDSEVDMGNISAEISRIFNYDRRRFNPAEESDDECMESSVAQQMREEQRSLRIGIQEDLEDIQREEEENRRKLLKLKKNGRR